MSSSSSSSSESKKRKHTPSFGIGYVALTTHPTKQSAEVKLNWGAETPDERRPVIGVEQLKVPRNAIGAHGGSYMVYKALAVANGSLDPTYKPDLHNTQPSFDIPPNKSWFGTDPYKSICTMDPWGHKIKEAFSEKYLTKGIDVRPTIAVTKAHIDIPEIMDMVRLGTLKADGKILHESGQISTGK